MKIVMIFDMKSYESSLLKYELSGLQIIVCN